MNISMQLCALMAVACALAATPAAGEARARSPRQRPTRGFKNIEMMTARGFGKRTQLAPRADLVSGAGGSMDSLWELLEGAPADRDVVDHDDRQTESIPVDWFVDEMLNNPEFARTVVRKFIDVNQDGVLSSDELLRNIF